MIKLLRIIKEALSVPKRYGCAMIYYHFNEMENIHKEIEEEDVYEKPYDGSYGLEDEPHCTLLYGLHEEVSTYEVRKVVEQHTFGTAKAENISLFENGEYDVLKFEVKEEELYEVNEKLKQFPYTSSFPDYNPHLTVAYLKLGTGKKYVKKFKGKSYDILPDKCVYSKADRTKTEIKINVD